MKIQREKTFPQVTLEKYYLEVQRKQYKYRACTNAVALLGKDKNTVSPLQRQSTRHCNKTKVCQAS